MIGGALCGINNISGEIQAGRLATAGFAFVVGLPLGFILFGPAMSITAWMTVVIGILFLMNLHSTWEVIMSLKYGGLDHMMARETINSVENITPTKEDWTRITERLARVQSNLSLNAMMDAPYGKRLLKLAKEGPDVSNPHLNPILNNR